MHQKGMGAKGGYHGNVMRIGKYDYQEEVTMDKQVTIERLWQGGGASGRTSSGYGRISSRRIRISSGSGCCCIDSIFRLLGK